MPNKLPCLAEVGDDKPFKANIKNIADTKYADIDNVCIVISSSLFYF